MSEDGGGADDGGFDACVGVGAGDGEDYLIDWAMGMFGYYR